MKGDAPEVQPVVYQPYAETDVPSYEQYADPAAAHGWQNAYDETQQLPRIGLDRGDGLPGGRADRRRAARRGDGRRRVMIAAGAVGAASLAAVIAGFSLSGSASSGSGGEKGGTRSDLPSVTDLVSSGGSAVPGTAESSGSSTATASPGESASADASAGPTVSGEPSTAPSSASSASVAPSPAVTSSTSDDSTPADTAPGNSNGKGRGRGH
ncbi:hypothetical protein [Streptomyces sp. NPDC001388]|uniref:hypothetical protein n=1 Tax=unclassified Streptomyces TaxID=2593676 RepID=UPI0036BA429A